MCLWLLTACLGLLPANPVPPANIVVVQGIPTPILQPTTTTTTTTTTTRATPTNVTMMPTGMPTAMPTGMPTAMPTGMPTAMPTGMPTAAPTAAPTVATTTTARPTTGNTPPSSTTSLTTVSPTIIIETNQTLTPNTSFVTNMPGATGLLSVILCTNPDIICVSNFNENTTGAFLIDPRLGSTPASAAFQGPPITGYNAQIQADTAVRFPRDKRDVSNDREISLFNLKLKKNIVNSHEITKRQSCRCVPAGTCVKTSNGAGMIDIRIVTPVSSGQCPSGQEYCCGSTTATISCGTLQTVPATSVTPAAGQASFGEYPWQALVLTKQNDYIAGGVLIDPQNVLTVTHRLSPYIVSGTAPNVKVRLGEWDAAATYEPVPYQEYNVTKVFTHPSFNPSTLQYDIAVLRLSASVPLTPMTGAATTINRACLPASSTATYTGQRCWVSGWGKNMFGLQGQYQQILKEVDVPIVASATCQTQMQNARLGPTFVLDTTSFICAGGEANKDSCTGDGGSGLVCNVNNQWVVIGLVAWGLGCANANVPAAYVNVAAFLPWIQQQVATA